MALCAHRDALLRVMLPVPDIHKPRPLGDSFAFLSLGRRSPSSVAHAWVAEGAEPAPSAEAASWVAQSLTPWRDHITVGGVIPPTFEAYCRVLHPARREAEGVVPVSWKEVAAWSGRVMHAGVQWEGVSAPAAGAK